MNMARATTYTWLPLDEWAREMGIDPWHFNGITHASCATESCGGVWYQHDWQSPRLSRENLARIIKDAENAIATYVGYNLLPEWDQAMVVPPRYHDPEYRSNVTTRGTPKSVRLPKSYVVEGGIRAQEEIELGATVSFVDKDGDGFDEIGQITVTSTAGLNEIRVYFPDKNGEDAWEIRPLTFTTHVSPFTIEIPVYMLLNPELTETLCVDDGGVAYDTADIYTEELDVYRVYNDTSQQADLIYDPTYLCGDDVCTTVSYARCVYPTDAKNGYVVYNAALAEEPDRAMIYYTSGYMDRSIRRPFVDISPYWKPVVARYASSLIDREVVCCGGDQSQIISDWRIKLDERTQEKAYATTDSILENLFGTPTRGAWWAYQRSRAMKVR